MAFSNAQEEAIRHQNGPMMVLAGPGSGKTTVITHRVRHLIEQCGVHPGRILVVTFTKAAANEMKQRFYGLMGGQNLPVSFGTFHSVFFAVLKQAYHYRAGDIIGEDVKQEIIRDLMRKAEVEIEDNDFVKDVISEISRVKGSLTDIGNYYSTNCPADVFKNLYTGYHQRIREMRKIDFDDMLTETYQLFQSRKDILSMWQQRYQYILIDEFQDINLVQYLIVRQLAKPEDNLFIVGDDDQSIYRFRGARPEIMLNFPKDYPEAETVLLDTNYRCSPQITDAAGRVIQNNKKRFDKQIKPSATEGTEIGVHSFENPKDQYKWLIKQIYHYQQEENIPLNEMAVLFRTNLGAGMLVEKLMEYNIPFSMKDMIPNIYEHWIARNIVSYIKVSLGIHTRQELLQIMNRPNRYISREALELGSTSLHSLKDFYQDRDWMYQRIDQMIYDLDMLKSMKPYAALSFIRSGIGYEGYLTDYAQYRNMEVSELLEVYTELHERSKDFASYDDWFAHIDEYTQELKEQAAKRNELQSNGISLMTMHGAKGLEFQTVFIVDVNEGVIPHQKALSDADIEEERRMFYVAMTRAKKNLHILMTKERFNKKMQMSRFTGELLLDRSKLEPGVKINHVKYGEGIIRNVSERWFVVEFPEKKQTKKLDIRFCIENQMLQN